MKRILALICMGSLMLALTARAQEQNNPNLPPKKGTQKAQPSQKVTPLRGRGGVSNVPQGGMQRSFSTAPFRQPTFKTTPTTPQPRTNSAIMNQQNRAGKFQQPATTTTSVRGQTRVAVPNKWTSPSFSGQKYAAFRNYHTEWHDRDWWIHHHDRIVFVFIFAQPFPFFFDAGFWFPAWGYYPGAYYPYDGPIYGYNGLPPDQVIVNVQTALQAQGYYQGAVDGVLGPLTRAAIANYQRDHGLAITAAVDEPTVASLGLA